MASGVSLGESFGPVLAAAQSGAEWAFARLYRDLNPLLLRYFASRAPREAEDLSIETWLGAARLIADFQGGEKQFRAWLFTIAHRRLVQYWRDCNRDPRTDASMQNLADVAGHDDVEAAVLDQLSGAEASRAIVSSLTPDQAEVVLLRVLGGLSAEEVAEVLGKRPGTVRVLQHKALRRLASSSSLRVVVNAAAPGRD